MDTKFKTEIKFADILKQKNAALYDRLELIKQKALVEWVPLLNFDRGSHSGYPHLINVERNADKMVPDVIKQEMTAGQIFLLLAAIFLHDIGKVTAASIEERGASLGNRVRLHHRHSEEIITRNWAELGLPDERIARYIGKIVYYHCVDNPFEDEEDIRVYNVTTLDPYGHLMIPFNAAILRIADETEASWTRSLQYYLYQRIKDASDRSLIKGVRRLIEDVEFCLKGECIIFHVPELKIQERAEGDEINRQTERSSSPGRESDSSEMFYLTRSEFEQLSRLKGSTDKVLTTWSQLLEEHHIAYRQAFYEYKNMLLTRLSLNDSRTIERQTLAEVFDQPNLGRRPKLQDLVDAIVSLSLGSLGHDTFTWQAIETKIGQALTFRERWIVERMNYASRYLYITFPSAEKLKIQLDHRHISELYRDLGCRYKGIQL
ncbi:MAG: HD domain-containing protein [candidate division KSB1 bacterium]|nr:HD domain-containing protein [candidate division KSB1 bacterium]